MTHDQYMQFNTAISAAADRAKLTKILALLAQMPESSDKRDLGNNAASKYLSLPE